MDSTFIIIMIILAFVCALIGRALASNKGRSLSGFWLGLVFGPIGIVIALLLPPIAEVHPHIDEQLAADFVALTKNEGKIGVGVSQTDGRTITNPTIGSPADRAGIKADDRLVMIDNQMCEGDYRDVIMRIIGEAGTKVKLTVRRGDERIDFDVIRE